jgi:hypothetical protein
VAANPLRTPDLYDVIRLAGKTSPGQCDLSGAHAPRKWDVFRGFGLSGATTVFTGIDIDKFSVRLSFWDPDQIDDYNTNFAPLLALPPRGKRPKSLDFYHPQASDPPIGIRSVGVQDVTQLQQVGDGLWAVDILLIPFIPPKPHVAKPIASSDERPKPEDARDRKIVALEDQVGALLARK